MPRTTDVEAHALRREEFLDAAQHLMQVKGYERMSVEDVLRDTGTSRGAFYHYFDSKPALLQAVVDRMADAVAAQLADIVEAPGESAVEKLQRFYTTIGSWKTARRDLLVAVLQVWFSDDNAILRDKFSRSSNARLVPLLERVLRQGCAEGTFRTPDPTETARLILTMAQGMSQPLGDLLVEGEPQDGALEPARRITAAYTDALERILGVAPGSVTIVDEATLRAWFTRDREEHQ